MKFRKVVFVQCFVTIASALSADEDDFQRSNYYTNSQGNNVGDIQNQDKNAAKRQDKKVEHFRNTHVRYHDSKKYHSYKNDHGVEDPNAQLNNGYLVNKPDEGRTNVEKRSQYRRGDSRVVASKSSQGHFHIPSNRVQYHDGGIRQSKDHSSHPKSDAQRLVRKSFNDQGNSNWKWGFRRKQSKDHPLKDASVYASHNSYKTKESTNGRNAQCEAMVRNGQFSENSDMDGNIKNPVIQGESKIVGTKNLVEQHQRAYAPRQELSEDRMNQEIGQPSIQQLDSRERAETDYQWNSNSQNTDLQQPKAAVGWVPEGLRNAHNIPLYNSKKVQSSYKNQQLESQNNVMPTDHLTIDYNQDLNGPVGTRVLNEPVENVRLSLGLLQDMPNNQLQPHIGQAINNNEQFQNLPKMDEQRFDQSQKGSVRYENGYNVIMPRVDSIQQPESVRSGAQDSVPRMGVVSRGDDQNQENRWDGGSARINAQRMKISPAVNKKCGSGNAPGSSALEQHNGRHPEQSKNEDIRYLVLSPAEFNRETLNEVLGGLQKPQGIPYCTLEEYKMESASLKSKSYDAQEREMRYNEKGSINELISRLKRNNHQTLKGYRRRSIKTRASVEGPEMPVHACTATPSQRENSVGIVTQTEAIHEATTMCWAESLTRPTVSAEDLGINFRITPSHFYEHLRGRFPVISQFDYTAGTSCSTPCEEKNKPTKARSKLKRRVRFFGLKHKRTPDEILLSDIIRNLQNSTTIPQLLDPKKILPNAPEEEKIIEKYLTALMDGQINSPKNQLKNVPFKAGPGWLEELLKELAEHKVKSKKKIAHKDKSRFERNNSGNSKLSMALRE